MGDKAAAVGVVAGAGLFGLSYAELGQMATIFAGFTGGLASLAALVYYIYQMVKGNKK